MYVEETISKYEKYINPAQAKLFRFMGLASVEGHAEGWTITDSEGKEFIDCLGRLWYVCSGSPQPGGSCCGRAGAAQNADVR